MSISGREKLMPQEETLEIIKTGRKLSIGLPKETFFQERRIALIPDAVKMLVENGHEIVVQRGAGEAAHFPDTLYAEAGARIVDDVAEVFKSKVILKIAPLSGDEIDLLGSRQTLMSALHLTIQSKSYFQRLIRKKPIAIAFELIKDKANGSPVLRSTSEIAGTTSIQIAAEYLSHEDYGNGRMLGGFTGIAPSEVVILGAGTVGEFAARMAIGMGALVKVFDNSIYKLQQLQSRVFQRVFTSALQPSELKRALKTADVLICATHAKHHRAPVIVTEEMVAGMKEGAVIVDVSIDQGGCVETSKTTSHHSPVFRKYGVTHYCVPNIASRVPQTASIALSNFFAPMLQRAGQLGGLERLLEMDFYFRQGVYIFNGLLTNKMIGEQFDLPSQDIDLLMAAFH
ncbi:MAG: alanine dehydrogenase [Bacteroidota bacterium]